MIIKGSTSSSGIGGDYINLLMCMRHPNDGWTLLIAAPRARLVGPLHLFLKIKPHLIPLCDQNGDSALSKIASRSCTLQKYTSAKYFLAAVCCALSDPVG